MRDADALAELAGTTGRPMLDGSLLVEQALFTPAAGGWLVRLVDGKRIVTTTVTQTGALQIIGALVGDRSAEPNLRAMGVQVLLPGTAVQWDGEQVIVGTGAYAVRLPTRGGNHQRAQAEVTLWEIGDFGPYPDPYHSSLPGGSPMAWLLYQAIGAYVPIPDLATLSAAALAGGLHSERAQVAARERASEQPPTPGIRESYTAPKSGWFTPLLVSDDNLQYGSLGLRTGRRLAVGQVWVTSEEASLLREMLARVAQRPALLPLLCLTTLGTPLNIPAARAALGRSA